MERKTRFEVINEYYFASPLWDENGYIVPASQEVLAKYEELQGNWLTNHPRSSNEIPGVALYPIFKEGKEGYIVATQVVYKNNFVSEV